MPNLCHSKLTMVGVINHRGRAGIKHGKSGVQQSTEHLLAENQEPLFITTHFTRKMVLRLVVLSHRISPAVSDSLAFCLAVSHLVLKSVSLSTAVQREKKFTFHREMN